MTIDFRCSHCHKSLRTADEYAGRQVKCPDCGTQLAVPARQAGPPRAVPPPLADRGGRPVSPPPPPPGTAGASGPTGGSPPPGPPTLPDDGGFPGIHTAQDQPGAGPAARPDLVGSYFESWSLYFGNLGSVWAFVFTMGFRALGALFSCRLLQFALAVTDFLVKLKHRDRWPSANLERLLELGNTQLGVASQEARKAVFDAMVPAVLAVLIAVIGAPFGVILGLLVGFAVPGVLSVLPPILGLLAPIVLAAIIYFRSLATLMLRVGLLIKLGPGGARQRQRDIEAMVKQHANRFAGYLFLAAVSSCAGLILCCVGVFLTTPYFPTAAYVGMINTLGITKADVEKFLG